jgi:hypothetical protein
MRGEGGEMITREDIEYAAKACGIKDIVITTVIEGGWNPDTNEADCWRMCRQLEITVSWSYLRVSSGSTNDCYFGLDTGLTDMEAATLVAAQIGRAL